jgi:hypothetical protein
MIDLEREAPVTLAEAPKLIPAINAVPGMESRKPLHPRTLYNWATRGKNGVTLETTPVGGILVTTREALQRFFARLTEARQQRFYDRDRHQSPRHRPMHRRQKAVDTARARLAQEHGI